MTGDWERNEKCAKQGHPGHELARQQFSNGSLHYCMWCYACGKNITRGVDKLKRDYLPKLAVETKLAALGRRIEDIPIVNGAARVRMCYACSDLAFCEDDHVAERTIHGDLAEQLPIVPLCTKCHQLKTTNLQAFMRRLRGEHAA